jgi:hypothetical protein
MSTVKMATAIRLPAVLRAGGVDSTSAAPLNRQHLQSHPSSGRIRSNPKSIGSQPQKRTVGFFCFSTRCVSS